MRALGVIPARYASTRFPGKPLALIAGKPMIEWVYGAAKKCTDLDHVVVATDDARIADAVRQFGGEAVMTRDDHVSGFDRIVEVASKFSGFTHYVNVQGDEPLLPAANISGAVALFREHGEDCHIATTAVPFSNEADEANENMVKVVLAHDARALYFSRSRIPFYRKDVRASLPALKHQGLYAYSREALLKLAKLPVAALEEAESLEQLRFLYNGFNIFVHIAREDSPGVDVPEDIKRVEQILQHAV
ncbi:3-deoxy-manno-octulosonate cytidylyltransferase [Turneriella parva]|uniref:3-deoxy-manno-octulosonate cytidylyltransferase n=1 Tax=Turneriella parva (strain ATCC BAA-1111 / DSM 21527 / NCTC 11395 / H) TaxID=869212 RepID=I4BAV0_TURPD|nr:3-deoxy-manno-octulosonate cytidylyltransferase [Turneriella parva]AFM14407.1 3-deoxy-manno-octulosonate cytidylyltransferase [Turneriella parva DSM 21527]